MTTLPHAPTVLAWAQQFGRYDDPHTQKVVADTAEWLAEIVREAPLPRPATMSAAVMSPGNGTRYVIVAGRLHPDLADMLGGSILVALPQLGGRRAIAVTLDQYGPWTPDWVEREFGLLPSDAILVASVLTLTTDQLQLAADRPVTGGTDAAIFEMCGHRECPFQP